MGRAPCCDKAKVKKGPWSVEEDALLQNFIMKFGNDGTWISLPKKAGLNRCGKSCRLRWLNYLRPDINHGDFTDEEDRIIYTLYHNLGSRWSVIASNLPGRTDNDVKNYWNTKLKKKIMAGKIKNFEPSISIVYNPEISANTDLNYISMNSNHLQKLGTGMMGTDLGQNQIQLHLGNGEIFSTMEESFEKYARNSSVSHETGSHAGSSSHGDSDQNSSSSVSTIMSNGSNYEDEFWMDLLSESFDDVVAAIKLEEKISEIASLLDV